MVGKTNNTQISWWEEYTRTWKQTDKQNKTGLIESYIEPKLKPSLITSTWLHLIISKIFIILHPYCWYLYTLFNLFAHSFCTFLLILLFNKSTVLHIFLYCTFFIIMLFFYIYTYIFLYFIFFHTYINVYSLVFVLHIIALSMERIWLTFHCWLYSV